MPRLQPAINFAALIEPVAQRLLGEHNARLSKSPVELRYGTHGSMAINIAIGTWFDHQDGVGGGVLDLIERVTGARGVERLNWLRREGLLDREPGAVPDRARRSRSAQQHLGGAPNPPAKSAAAPMWTMPDAKGEPRLYAWGDEGPPRQADELRRHVYRAGKLSVRIKFKSKAGRWSSLYRVRDPEGQLGWQWKKPPTYGDVPYITPIDPFDAELANDLLLWPEGEKDVDRLAAIDLPAFTFGGTGDLPASAEQYAAGRHVVILADNDDAGRRHAECKAAMVASVAASMKVITFEELPHKADVSDWIAAGGTREALIERIDGAPPWTPSPGRAPRVSSGRSLVIHRAADIMPEKIEWLWPARIAIGKHTTIAGDPGTGKSQITVSIAAAITTGGDLPCGEGRAPLGNVIFLSAEDGVADTIIPRLIAAGADLRRVHVVTATCDADGKGHRSFNLQADIELLQQKISEIENVVLIIIDPVSAYMGGTDSHKNAEVRGALAPLSDMAERMRVAILSVTHFSKGGGGAKALYRFIGSVAFTAAPRAAFVVAEDPEDKGRCLFLHGKNNLAAPPQGLAYRLEQRLVDESNGIIASSVVWENEPVIITADEALRPRGDAEPTAKQDAIEFLCAILAGSPMKVIEIESEAWEAGLLDHDKPIGQSKAFRTARKELGIKPYQQKGQKAGGWFWALPHQMPSKGQGI